MRDKLARRAHRRLTGTSQECTPGVLFTMVRTIWNNWCADRCMRSLESWSVSGCCAMGCHGSMDSLELIVVVRFSGPWRPHANTIVWGFNVSACQPHFSSVKL